MVITFETPGSIHCHAGFPVGSVQFFKVGNSLFWCLMVTREVWTFQAIICDYCRLKCKLRLQFGCCFISHICWCIPPENGNIAIVCKELLNLWDSNIIDILCKSLLFLCRIPMTIVFFCVCINYYRIGICPSFRCRLAGC